ncbi:hypothetical protein NWP21_10785 [Anabaenopsis sp. FSS-46]|nr:hypothetical protein [Anabaenopsis sp. FSS-46]MDH6099316.1 hypothetical protein [Anabaenopsis sp. FSS-46]
MTEITRWGIQVLRSRTSLSNSKLLGMLTPSPGSVDAMIGDRRTFS